MTNSFTEVTSKSWLSRIMDSIKSVLIGIVLFLASFVVLFWNEGRAVTTARSLEEGAKAVVSVDAQSVLPENDGKLIHFSGRATTTDLLKDTQFGVSAAALKLERKAEMYQWVEEKKTEKHTKIGGGEETTTTYTYTKKWSEKWNDSSEFKQSADHVNPQPTMTSQSFVAPKITVGAFTLSPNLVSHITASVPLDLPADSPASTPDGFKKTTTGYYHGTNESAPAVGDMRISFAAVQPQDVSVVPQQSSGTLHGYQTKAGRTLEMLEPGTMSAAQMFQEAQTRSSHLTWILRLVGFLAMWFGLMLVLNPFKVMADVVPFLGGLVGAGLALITLGVALPMSLLTIAVAWFFYRPLLSIGLLAIAAAAAAALWMIHKKRRAQATAQLSTIST